MRQEYDQAPSRSEALPETPKKLEKWWELLKAWIVVSPFIITITSRLILEDLSNSTLSGGIHFPT